ncbi:MAG TPA: hypothetical protein VMB03_10420 [Bryobacteraceae bacterium]|nr:hypothetical protein [Bryobacteraceae bacterium]
MVSRFLVLMAAIFALAASLAAQSPSITVNSVSIDVNPSGTDSYSLQGTFSGLATSDSSYVNFAVGNFIANFPISAFTVQPGGNIWTYQDATGQAPGWLSSLTLNWTAQTFSAQAKGIVLAGLTNPFAVQLGAANTGLCTMVRVQQSSPGNYQLNSSDPAGMTCELSNAPTATPKVVMAGTATNVTVELSPQQFTANDTLADVQLFQADDNAQPQGAALCTLKPASNGDDSCVISINQASAGTIPMVIQATAGGATVLSPGFAVQVAEPATTADMQQISSVENVALQAWQNIAQYGDTAWARTQTLMALRKLLSPPVELTAQPFGLAADGLSIYVRTNSGVPVNVPLVDAAEQFQNVTTQAPGPVPALAMDRADAAQAQAAQPPPGGAPRAGAGDEPEEAPVCPSNARDIVWSDQVLVWAPSTLWGFTAQNDVANVLGGSQCPYFTGKIEQLDGAAATVASLKTFTKYGTIIMETQGGRDDQGYYFLSGDTCPSCSASQLGAMAGNSGFACIGAACYVAVYPNNTNLQPLTTSSILYAGFSYSMQGKTGFKTAFVPPGATNAYFGYYYSKTAGDEDRFGVPLMVLLVNQYKDAGESYLKVRNIAPSKSFSVCSGSKIVLANCVSKTQEALKKNPYFQFSGDENVGYMGNPTLETTELNPPQAGSQGLAAFMEGGGSCGPNGGTYLSVAFKNSVKAGHLYPLTGNANGEDSFTEEASDPAPADAQGTLVSDAAYAKYTADATLGGTMDNISAMFSPGPNAKAIAKACLTVGGNSGLFVDSYLDTTYNGSNPGATSMVATNLAPPVKVTGTYNAPLTDPNGYTALGANASIKVTANGNNNFTITLTVGGVAPGANQGPYDGTADISVEAVNPGEEGQAQVQITGAYSAATTAALAQCASQPVCSFPDGSVYISGPNVNDSIELLDQGALPFAVTADSSTGPVDIYVGMNANGESSTPQSFTIILNITLINPQ